MKKTENKKKRNSQHRIIRRGLCEECKCFEELTKYQNRMVCRACMIVDDTRYMPAPRNMFERLGDC